MTPYALVVNPADKPKANKNLAKGKKKPRKKNPEGILKAQVIPALTAGGSAVAAGVAMDYVMPFLPEQLQTGLPRLATEGALVVAAGMALEKTKLIKDKKMRNDIIQGTLTVLAYKGIAGFIAESGMLPGSEVGAYQGLGAYQKSGMGAYERVSPRKKNGMGYMSFTPVAGQYNFGT